MGQRASFAWTIAACCHLLIIVGGSISVAHAAPMNAPPLPAGPPVPTVIYDVPPVLTKPLIPIDTIGIDRGRLRITTQAGKPLMVKNRFILSNPSRVIIDIADAQLGKAGIPFPPMEIDGVSVNAIRFGQFTEDTVRVVIETKDPERFQVANAGTALSISASRENLVSGWYRHVFSRNEAPKAIPHPVAAIPAARPVPPAASASAGSYTSIPPQLDNLRRLSMEQAGLGMAFPNRNRILEIARSQVGLSKDTDPDYVIQTFSRGKDQDWCADFISTILDWAGGSPWGHLSKVQDIYDWGLANRQLLAQPEPGSVVIFSNDGKNYTHTAFVESVNPDNTLTTIGGNEGYAQRAYKTTGSVERTVYKLEDKRIRAFVNPVLPSNINNTAARMPEPPIRF